MNPGSRQERRENPDPQELSRPIPWAVLVFALACAVWGSLYIATSGPFVAAEHGDGRSLDDLRAQASTTRPGAGMADGAALYAARCAACHQASGAGLPGVFPPLAGSEWVLGKEALLIQILLHGIEGELRVKETVYKGSMPAFGAQLDDAELAAVASHVRRQWGNGAGPVTAAAVTAQRQASAQRKTPWQGEAELATLR